MRLLEGPRKGIRSPRNNNQVHVIGHQAVAKYRKRVQPDMAPEKFEINEALAIRVEQKLPCVTTMGDVMRNIRRDDTRKTRHPPHNTRSSPGFPISLKNGRGEWI